MATGKNVTLPEDLLTAVAQAAQAEGKTTDEVIEQATRLYLARQRLDRFVRRNEARARERGISEADVPRLIEDWRREQRGR
jgi:ribbon-helix-helix CopG family protein